LSTTGLSTIFTTVLALAIRKQLRAMPAKVHVDIHLLKDAP
jgi:hypothetical protein